MCRNVTFNDIFLHFQFLYKPISMYTFSMNNWHCDINKFELISIPQLHPQIGNNNLFIWQYVDVNEYGITFCTRPIILIYYSIFVSSKWLYILLYITSFPIQQIWTCQALFFINLPDTIIVSK